MLTRSIGNNGHSYWHVLPADEGLVHCGGSNYALVGSEGDALASTPDDSTVYMSWLETEPRVWRNNGWRTSHSVPAMIIVAGDGH